MVVVVVSCFSVLGHVVGAAVTRGAGGGFLDGCDLGFGFARGKREVVVAGVAVAVAWTVSGGARGVAVDMTVEQREGGV